MNNLRFSIYEHRLVYKGNRLLQRNFIVLKDEQGIVGWTKFHEYIKTGKKQRVKAIARYDRTRFYNVTKLLNYAFFDKHQIKSLNDLSKEIVCNFLNDYGLCQLPDDSDEVSRSKTTVDRCIYHIIDFLDEYICNNKASKLGKDDIYKYEEVFSVGRKKYIKKKMPAFDVCYIPNSRSILRDMPESVFKIIFNNIMENHRNILMLIALSAFAGLRPSEACNVRRIDSPLGPGMRFEYVGEEITNISIDLMREQNLRSDLISVGDIKKERNQKVYPAFISAFYECYQLYMNFIEGRKYETDYAPLTSEKKGKAITYQAYYAEFRNAVKECIPIMLSNNDPEVVNYGNLLLEKNIGPHIFRHWFSVKLTLFGEDVAGLMFWRGDKSPQSALTYIMNKSELVKQYEKVSSEIFDYSLWKAGKIHK
jgi:integrase